MVIVLTSGERLLKLRWDRLTLAMKYLLKESWLSMCQGVQSLCVKVRVASRCCCQSGKENLRFLRHWIKNHGWEIFQQSIISHHFNFIVF